MKKLSVVFTLLLFMSCSQEKLFVEDFVAEAFHQAIALEKIEDISDLLDRDTIYVFPQNISLLKDNKNIYKTSMLIPSHVDKWKLKLITKTDLDGFIKTNQIPYLNLSIKEKEDKIIIELEKAFEYSEKDKGMVTETNGIKIIFKKTSYPKILEIGKTRIMYTVD